MVSFSLCFVFFLPSLLRLFFYRYLLFLSVLRFVLILIDSVTGPTSSVPTTESDPSAGDQLASLPTFQTSTLRGPSSCITPTPRGILTRPSNSPRSAVPTPLALQNIEGERRRMFGSGNVYCRNHPRRTFSTHGFEGKCRETRPYSLETSLKGKRFVVGVLNWS